LVLQYRNGVTILDKETKEVIEVSKSKIVAKKAFWQTALTRVLIPVPSIIN